MAYKDSTWRAHGEREPAVHVLATAGKKGGCRHRPGRAGAGGSVQQQACAPHDRQSDNAAAYFLFIVLHFWTQVRLTARQGAGKRLPMRRIPV